ncbi:hypothetical protein ACFY2J_38850 [Streptomyces collinus]|uniref:hypothetical protein n=1 Tax=Streptomyces collinus TaxID=42684 RepID=UPI00368A5706
MSEAWAAIVAAVTAGAFGMGGVLAGIYVGRRQTTDQAHVEHGQWLRGQRQEAYLAFTDTWDTVLQELRALQESWDERVHEWQEAGGGYQHPAADAEETLAAAWVRVRSAVESIDLLGPQRVDETMRRLEDAFVGMRDEILAQPRREPPWVDPERWGRALSQAMVARGIFHAAAIRTLRTPPSPEEEGEL